MKLLKTLSLLIILLCNSVFAQVAQFPQIYFNGQGSGGFSLNIRSSASSSASVLTTLSVNSKIGAESLVNNSSDPTFMNFVKVCLPSISSTNNSPNYGYMPSSFAYAQINESNNYATVNTTSTPLGVRTCANCTSTYVTISSQNAYFGKNSILALTGSTSSGWYEVYLTNDCSQSTGWVNGIYLTFPTAQSYYNVAGNICDNSGPNCQFAGNINQATITLGSLGTTYSSGGYYQYKVATNWSGNITCSYPSYTTSNPTSYSYTANSHNYSLNFFLSNTASCTAPIASINSPSGASPLTITCTASGGSGGSILYKWYSGTSCSGTVLGTNSTLSVTTSGDYTCKAYISGYESTCYQCATGTATITTNCSSPSATANSPAGTSPLTMTCTSSGGSGGSILYKWYSGTSCSGTVLGTNSTLSVTSSGSYSCKAYISGFESTCNQCATGTATITTACSSPTASINSPSGTSPLTMTCTASGGSGGSILYKWYSGTSCSGTVLGSNSTLSVTSSGSFSCKAYISGYESTCYQCATGTATITSGTVTGTITSTLGNGYFIQGVSTVNNTFSSIPSPSTGITKVIFKAGSVSVTDNSSVGGWSATFDMGQLPPSTVVKAEYYNGSTLLGTSSSYSLNILTKPSWLNYATVSNVSVSNGNINMDIGYAFQNSINSVPNYILGLGGKDYSLSNNALTFGVSFNMTSRSSTISNAFFNLLFNTLDIALKTFQVNIPASPSADLHLDNNFNLIASLTAQLNTQHYPIDMPTIIIPLEPGVEATLDAGLSIYGTLKARLLIGNIGGQWGFVNDNGDKTWVTAKVEPTGNIQGGLMLLYGAVSGKASLIVSGRVGGGLEYQTVPTYATTPLFGGDIDISGTAKITALWGLWHIATYGPKSFYYELFGDSSALRQVNSSFDERYGASSVTYHFNGTNILPNNNPQPCLSTRGGNLYVAWVENDSTTGYLCFSKLDSAKNSFATKIIVSTNKNSISNPKIAPMEDGSALFSWSQNRYTEKSLPNGISTFDGLKAQDIWFGFYDATSNSITKTAIMVDDTSTFQSGRLEGQATTAFGSNRGLVTWVVKDPIAPGSDIWFSHITNSSGVLSSTTPKKLFDLPGTNRNVDVAFTDSSNALAIWINDPDAIDSTLNSKVVFSEWNGTSWSLPLPMSSNNSNSFFNETSIANNNGYTAAAFTSTVIDLNNKFQKRLEVTVWDNITKQWNASKGLVEIDSSNYLAKPTVSISHTGIATVTYQVQNKYPDTTKIEPGKLCLYAKDLNKNIAWTKNLGNAYLCDSNTYVWDLASGFSSGNNFYTLTQEYNENGIVTNPKNGVIFGDPNLSLVLRGLRVNDNMTLSNIKEPSISLGISKQTLNTFSLLQNYPNPFSKSTCIEFNIIKSSFVTLEVFNVTGVKVATLLNQKLSEGIYKTIFDSGNLDSGEYFYKLSVDDKSISKQMLIAK